MRKYTLASPTDRGTVDLRDYESVIVEAVHSVMDNAVVKVEKDYYCVEPTPKRGDAIRIGREICKSELGKYCIRIPKLFSSVEVSEGKEELNDRKKQKQSGGHF